MRRVLPGLALAFSIALAGAAIAAPVLHLSGWKASAGNPETFTITRVSGNGAATVTFATGAPGDVAQPGVDYAPTTQVISWQPRQTTATVTVATYPRPAYAGRNITFTATASVNGRVTSAQGLIMEPTAPPPVTQTCPDGSVIAASSTCPPAPPPAISWVTAALTNGGFARCAATGGCHGFGYNPNADSQGLIAHQGDVMVYAWNGVTAGTSGVDMRVIAAVWPQGQYKVPGDGSEGFADEWEGVAPAS